MIKIKYYGHMSRVINTVVTYEEERHTHTHTHTHKDTQNTHTHKKKNKKICRKYVNFGATGFSHHLSH